MSVCKLSGLTLLLTLLMQALSAQVVRPVDSTREFEIIKGPSLRLIRIDSNTTLQTIAGGAVIYQGATKFYADSVVLNSQTNFMEAFGNVHINQGDTIQTYGDYLRYSGKEKLAFLSGNVRILGKDGTLHTQELDYNLESGIAHYYKGGKVVTGKDVITSKEGTYYADTRNVIFNQNVFLDGEKNNVYSDSLMYNMDNGDVTFISESIIENKEVEIQTLQGHYDMKTGDALFTARTVVVDSSGTRYAADRMAMEGSTNNAQMEGNAIIIDTANNFVLLANQIYMNQVSNSFLATRKPVLIVIDKQDSTYIAADTIFSGLSKVLDEQLVLRRDSSDPVSADTVNKIPPLVDTLNFPITDSMVIRGDTIVTPNSVIPDSMLNIGDTIEIPKFINPPLIANDSLSGNEIAKDSLPEVKPRKPLKELQDKKEEKKRRGKIKKPVPDESDSLQLILPKSKSLVEDTLPAMQEDSLKQKKIPDSIVHNLPVKDSLLNKDQNVDTTLDSTFERDSITGNIHQRDTLSSNQPVNDSLSTGALMQDSLNKDSVRYFIAFHHVRIYNDSMQSISDSLFFSTADSVFRLYGDPVLWSGQSQISGDTMHLYTKNKKADRLYVFDRSLIVSRTDEGFFNQMAGKTINAYFEEGKIRYIRLKGSQAQSVYFLQNDDSAYIGMNRSSADAIDFYFENGDLQKVVFLNEVKGTMYPMKEIPAEQRRLREFEWLKDKRPKSKWELFE